jgi:hypothetical protein
MPSVDSTCTVDLHMYCNTIEPFGQGIPRTVRCVVITVVGMVTRVIANQLVLPCSDPSLAFPLLFFFLSLARYFPLGRVCAVRTARIRRGGPVCAGLLCTMMTLVCLVTISPIGAFVASPLVCLSVCLPYAVAAQYFTVLIPVHAVSRHIYM